MEKIKATLKETPVIFSGFDSSAFGKDWLRSSSAIEQHKRKILYEMKQSLHKKVAMLEMDDLKFEIID